MSPPTGAEGRSHTPVTVDASVVVAVLVGRGPTATWAAEWLLRGDLIVPALLPFEVLNVLRRLEHRGQLDATAATFAERQLTRLTTTVIPGDAIADRVWELRHNLTAYDAAYVAVAELVDATLVTLDRRLAGAPGLRCAVAEPPARLGR